MAACLSRSAAVQIGKLQQYMEEVRREAGNDSKAITAILRCDDLGKTFATPSGKVLDRIDVRTCNTATLQNGAFPVRSNRPSSKFDDRWAYVPYCVGGSQDDISPPLNFASAEPAPAEWCHTVLRIEHLVRWEERTPLTANAAATGSGADSSGDSSGDSGGDSGAGSGADSGAVSGADELARAAAQQEFDKLPEERRRREERTHKSRVHRLALGRMFEVEPVAGQGRETEFCAGTTGRRRCLPGLLRIVPGSRSYDYAVSLGQIECGVAPITLGTSNSAGAPTHFKPVHRLTQCG